MPEPQHVRGAQIAGPIDQIHLVSRDLKEAVFVPAHEPRTATPEYLAAHKKLVVDEDRPCLACGVTNSMLKDPKARADRAKNPVGAKQMETHHRIVEWSLMNALDVKKFNARVVNGLRQHHANDPKYQKDFTEQQMKDWVDHDEENLWVLCDVHHRHGFVGIHSISGPIWGPQDLLKDGYRYTPYRPDRSPARTGQTKPTSRAAKPSTRGARATRGR